VSTLTKDLDEICLALRVYLKGEITKTLQIVCDKNIAIAKEKLEKNRVGNRAANLR
jgi:hypothetical protein